jgi:lipopolysaccharide export system permease protein
MSAGRSLRYYIGRRFAMMIVGAFVVCGVLIFLIDLIELLRQGRRSAAATTGMMIALTAMRLPSYTEILLPFAVLVGSIGALLSLSRKSELTVMRAAGMSAWQFVRPGLTVAFLIGVVSVALYNPLAAAARAESERRMADLFGRETSLMQGGRGGLWLRQDSVDGPSVINAAASSDRGTVLSGVTVFRYSPSGAFLERIEARKAVLDDGLWDLQNALVSAAGEAGRELPNYKLATYLSKERAQDAFGSENSVSVWELPGLIEVAEKAKLPAHKYRVQYELLLSRPLLLMAMVLLAATVSLRSFRMGGVQTMVITGILGGVGFFLLTEVSRQAGVAGLVAAAVSVWAPVVVSMMVSLTVLLHQEDG